MTEFIEQTPTTTDVMGRNAQPIYGGYDPWPMEALPKPTSRFLCQQGQQPISRRDVRLFEKRRFIRRSILRLCRSTTRRVTRAARHR
jgi:hypothetical protein